MFFVDGRNEKVDWEEVLDVTWGVSMDKKSRRVYKITPPAYVVIHTRTRRIPHPPRNSDVARHLSEIKRCRSSSQQ